GPYHDLAMRWLAHDESKNPELAVFTQINTATNLDEFLAALDQFQTPAQNFAYADRAGNIALRIGGQLPLRAEGHGKFVLDGARSANGWPGFIPPRHNPVVINPERGFVASANQRSTDTDYPYFYVGGRYFEDYRGRILNEKLQQMRNITVSDMQALQLDCESLKAREFLPHLLGVLDQASLGGPALAVYDTLANWDYRYRASSLAPVYWEELYGNFYELVWDEFDAIPDSVAIVRPESWRTIDLAINQPASEVFDRVATPAKEQFDDIVRLAFGQAVDSIEALPDDLTNWGHYRLVTIRHLANVAPFNVTIDRAPGDGDALNATGSGSGPSWRMVVHLTDPIEAWVVYPGGQSGNPGSAHYDEMIGAWTAGTYYQAQFATSPEDLETSRAFTLQSRSR
ncbi:MAG: penicillin acylase family protein, partial [Saprospiraceae bacterium]|nr:penicillin acylase family protein [Saprospiraceae bacterium]